MGLSDDQEIYAKTINYKVCNKSTTQPVAEATIGISVEKAKIIMQRAAYIYHFDMWGISNSTRVRTELSKLTGDKEKREGERS